MDEQKVKLKLLLITALLIIGAAPADALHVHHDMQIRLDPDNRRIEGVDTLLIRPAPIASPILYLNPRATDLRMEMNGQPITFERIGAALHPRVPDDAGKDPFRLTITYGVRFDDPVPVRPLNTDNPGYGVSGTISPTGTLLLDGAGWYPHIDADRTTFYLRVEAPAGTVAVTAGRSLGHLTDRGRTVSTWQVDYPVRGLSLSAAPFLVRERAVGELTAATYLLPESAELADPYLAAIERYLQFYTELFGPYPFEKFAVVENFFPTGFGFPSYTLMGSRVLRLPFIIGTSLGHEIAHCWWGNGVYVDMSGGNWSEGLTTYVADYLYKERESTESAREYRRQILRNYATLINSENDFPIGRFQSRIDPQTKTIGYDKCAMVFHMLRRRLGDEVFWGSLRDIYRQYLFKPVAWRHIRESFERRAAVDLKDFFAQWIDRDGAPRLALQDVTTGKENGRWRTRGKLLQDGPFYYDAEVEISLNSAEENTLSKISTTGSQAVTEFEIVSAEPPKSLVVDPDVNFFRKLDRSEIPTSINTLKGADAVLIVLADGTEEISRPLATVLAESLGLDNYRLINENNENQVSSAAYLNNDILLIGYGGSAAKLLGDSARLKGLAFTGNQFTVDDQTYRNPSDSFFGVFDHPFETGRAMALFLPLSTDSAEEAARKITHYGKYSYLVFGGGQNRTKGIWPIENSPLIHRFIQQ